MDDLFEFMKKISREKAEAIATGAEIHKKLEDMHQDNADFTQFITVCVYCGSQTEAPCCGENHHEEIPVDRDGNDLSVPNTPSKPRGP